MCRDFGTELFRKANGLSDLRLLARAHQGFPRVLVDAAQQEHLDMSARRLAPTMQARWKNARVVEDQSVAWRKKCGQIVEMAMLDAL